MASIQAASLCHFSRKRQKTTLGKLEDESLDRLRIELFQKTRDAKEDELLQLVDQVIAERPATCVVPLCPVVVAGNTTQAATPRVVLAPSADGPADPKWTWVSWWLAVICCHIWSAPGVLWAHAPSRPRIPKWFVGLMFVLTSCAVLLFLVGLAGGPALEAIPVLSSNSTGPDKTTNTTNGTSVVPSVVPGAVVAVSEWLMQLLQSPWTNQFNPVVVYLAVHREPAFQWFLQQLGVQQRQAHPRHKPPPPSQDAAGLFLGAGFIVLIIVGGVWMATSVADA